MTVLVIDTATERAVVAAIKEGSVLFQAELPFGWQSSHKLMPALNQGMQASGLQGKDVAFIAVGAGPGSYTGLRVGATVAKVLSFAWQAPLVGVSSLKAFLPSFDEGIFSVVIDAKISGVYLYKGIRHGHLIEDLIEPTVATMESAFDLLADSKEWVTPHAALLKKKIDKAHGHESAVSLKESYPSIHRLADLGWQQYRAGLYSRNGDIELHYMRKVQAEIDRLSKE